METELKLKLLDPDEAIGFFDHDLIRGLLIPDSRNRLNMHSVYYDTLSRDLNKLMATLRVRSENDSRVMTVKLAGTKSKGLHQRLEWNLVLGRDTWEPDLSAGFDAQSFQKYAISDGDPENELKQVMALIDSKPLVSICEARFTRECRDVHYGDTIMELALDDGCLKGGKLEEKLLELELELKKGDIDDLLRLGEFLQMKFSLIPELRSKYARCLDLLTATEIQD